VVLKKKERKRKKERKTQHLIPLEILHTQDSLYYSVHTQQADREHCSWLYVTRRPGFLKSLPVVRWAMSSVHGRLAECEQLNGRHPEYVIFRVE
jgi:hypothetical protein